MKARAEEAREASCARIAGQQQAAKIALAKSESSSYDLVKQIISDVSRKNDEKMAQMAAQVRSLCERVAATEMDLTEMCAKLKEAETKSVQALAYAQEAKSICEKREQEKAGDVDLNESIRRGLLKRQRQFSFRPRTNALHPMK
ncbi:hypothetical protein JKP88DRAFT_241206 [Tribonema minus]|uniref:Uncharacterized protein n=1 Tax=Tribonema minus TaxID=303371 RepID=A0A835YZK7_9STRA|nr:hypothetical protein JKP88DRAFT_241206 [Tribonema minus]